jgi:ribonuclease P protein component
MTEARRNRYGPVRRLHRKSEYDLVFARGVTVRDALLKVSAVPNGLGRTRLGTTVSKKASRSAVGRNRIRRRIREAFRLVYGALPAGLDLVAVPLAVEPEPKFDALAASLLALAKRAEEKLARRIP